MRVRLPKPRSAMTVARYVMPFAVMIAIGVVLVAMWQFRMDRVDNLAGWAERRD
jgi:hypothetical protein